MTRTQTKLRPAAVPQIAKSPAFQIVREGEPAPRIAHVPLPPPKKKRTRARQTRAAFEAEPHCPLCDGLITRFDGDTYLLHGRCAPCHEALTV